MKAPLHFRFLGFLRNIIDNKNYSKYIFKKLSTKEIFFIQIGANDGVSQDPIFKYSEKWKGILIEPLKEPFNNLIKNYENKRTGKYFENVAIGENNGEIEMIIPKIGNEDTNYATKVASIVNNNTLNKFDTETQIVKQTTLSSLLKKYNVQKIDLLVLDVEGYELNIINSYSFDIKPQVIYLETRFFNYNDLVLFYERMIKLGYSIFPERDNCLLILK